VIVILPPSETKAAGGAPGSTLDLGALAFPPLGPTRERVLDATIAAAEAAPAAATPARQRWIDDDRALRSSPTMPAIDRYTGVLFDALDAASLDAASRSWLGEHVLIQSAPFGPVGALDGIPPYRLAAGTSLPGVPALRRIWADAVRQAWAQRRPDFVLDLRSEAYAALGPLPEGVPSAYVRVMSEDSGGRTRALNHFNKHAKGELVRSLACRGVRIASLDEFVSWASDAGWVVRPGEAGEVALIV